MGIITEYRFICDKCSKELPNRNNLYEIRYEFIGKNGTIKQPSIIYMCKECFREVRKALGESEDWK